MSESIPRALQPPVAVALAKLVRTFPRTQCPPGRDLGRTQMGRLHSLDIDRPTGLNRRGRLLETEPLGLRVFRSGPVPPDWSELVMPPE